MNFFEAILLGILQGLTEFLPVSSSGQLVVAEKLFNLDAISPRALQDFDIFLHAGTLVALLIFFRQEFRDIFVYLGQKIRGGKAEKASGELLIKLLIATVPAALAGIFLEDKMENIRQLPVIATFLGITAITFFLAEKLPAQKTAVKITRKNAVLIGIFQAIAVLPGISRSGFTIAGGLFQGIKREHAARFSFLLAVPIIGGAGLLSLMNTLQNGFDPTLQPAMVITGFLCAAISSFFTAKFILKLFRRLSLRVFAALLLIESAALIFFATTGF